jgi:Protein of unknown function (DUF3363)
MLRTAMGPAITGWLEGPAIVEIMLNPDGRLWIDRLIEGLSDTGKRLSAEDGERIVRPVAHHVGAEVHPGSPRLSAELPETGERFEGLIPPIVAAPAFAIRKPAVAIFTLADYARAGIMTAEQADASRGPQATLRVLSAYDLDRQITSDGASWLDRRLLSDDRSGIADIGFGAEVRRAMAQRTDELVRRAHAPRVETARCASEPTYSARLCSTRSSASAANSLSNEAHPSDRSRMATVFAGLSFSLVPWRPVIKREIGRELFGVIRGNDISWQLGAFEGSALECNYTYRVASQRARAQTRRMNTQMTCCTIYRCASISIEGGHAVGASYSGDRTSHSLPGLMWPQPSSRQRK